MSVAATLLVMLASVVVTPAQNPAPSVQTLCVLDFQRLGDDARSDWLEQGLADLMIGTMSSRSPYLVIERKHLRDILREHGLAESGLIDPATAVRRARLAKAELLLLGSFARRGDDLTIQARLVRVSDQRVIGQAIWTGRMSEVLSAPTVLSGTLLGSSSGSPYPGRPVGIEHYIPPSVDVAKSYYLGVRAFDAGQYPESLAHYLDASRAPGEFRKADGAVLEMYYLLGRSEHAVLAARELARASEAKGDVAGAVEYYFAAARESLDPLNDPRSARDLLEKLLQIVKQRERKSGEIARTRRAILSRIAELQVTSPPPDTAKIQADRKIRHQVWLGDIESELTRRAETQARGGLSVLENGTWIKRPVPEPSLLMWRIRALSTLARAEARLGEIKPALDRYRELLEEYDFLIGSKADDGRLVQSIRTEAHFMMLRHYARTGLLIRDHAANRVNRLNVVSKNQVFTRDFRNPALDQRARVASRYEGRAYEYFDFAAPQGYQIDAVTLRAAVEGIAEFAFDVPNPAGWPPQYSLGSRLKNFKFSRRGTYEHTATPPPGTEFLSLGTAWGPGLFSNTRAEVEHWKLNQPSGGQDIVRWEVSFVLSPKTVTAAPAWTPVVKAPPGAAVQKVIDRYASGWAHVSVVRDAESMAYAGNPRLDVYAEDWLVYPLDGDIRIILQRDPQLDVRLPISINSREREFDPSLVRTLDGRYALLWARGTSKTNAARFVSFTADLLRWETPQRLVFEPSPAALGYTYAQAEPLERTYNIAASRKGYVMLLAQGFVRHSEDLRTWGAPRKGIAQDLDRNRLVRSRDGTLWALYETSSPERQPFTQDDWLHGYFVVDGKSYRHVTELRASRSADGLTWQEAGKITVPGQPSGLWGFAVDERRIGVAVNFNNLYVKWFAVSPFADLEQIDADLPTSLMHQSEAAEFFVRDGVLTCIRPVFDFEKQKPMLLSVGVERGWGDAGKR